MQWDLRLAREPKVVKMHVSESFPLVICIQLIRRQIPLVILEMVNFKICKEWSEEIAIS
jgi:hypothetical protein